MMNDEFLTGQFSDFKKVLNPLKINEIAKKMCEQWFFISDCFMI